MPQSKKTLVIGATPKPERYAYIATEMLHDFGHEVVPYGIKRGKIGDYTILNEWPHSQDFDTVTRDDGVWVLHGHTIVEQAQAHDGRIAIDTGAYATGILTAAHVTRTGTGVTFLHS